MNNNENTTHPQIQVLSCLVYTSLDLRDGQTDTPRCEFGRREAARETSLNSAPLAKPNQFHGQNAPVRQIWRPSLVCTSQPHSARNDDLLLFLGSTVQSSIIHFATGGSTLPFSQVELNGSGTSSQKIPDLSGKYLPLFIYPSLPLFLFPFDSSLSCTVMVIAAG
ncbi:hypothetical protein ASPBRDRAFT_442725 [Aspergillus brasiliensis CBS 101740]|uniref:Uncharacterized protein n=1 Tax=Aspergillus brasiliensis (strain CBS 101740 / IMI 381727 / IBT 21946) TaxID=767769 RepID=A0A1L9URC5_ASPBC|nr:hypothetical protein ASPBRDRAFT_442725 [Aspergillus brasiliensis CBS 101740]